MALNDRSHKMWPQIRILSSMKCWDLGMGRWCFYCIILSIKYMLILTQLCTRLNFFDLRTRQRRFQVLESWIRQLLKDWNVSPMSRFRHQKGWITTCGLSTSAGNLLTFFFAVCNNRPVRVKDRKLRYWLASFLNVLLTQIYIYLYLKVELINKTTFLWLWVSRFTIIRQIYIYF